MQNLYRNRPECELKYNKMMSEKDSDSSSNYNSLECWDYSIELECMQGAQDLQLAAELGKTLLERNKELETSLKQHQNVIEDQSQEIEYLTKQTVALREVNDSRLRIYEQLEVSIHDLERANHRLAIDNSSEKKQIKNLTAAIESLELKCDELQGTIDDLTLQLSSVKRRTTDRATEPPTITQTIVLRPTKQYDEKDLPFTTQFCSTPITEKTATIKQHEPLAVHKELENIDLSTSETDSEQVSQLLTQLRESRTLFIQEQKRANDLEEQLSTMVQQNDMLEKQVVRLKDEEAKSMHEELITLEEVRQGQLCSRCLRTIDSPRLRDSSSCLGDDADDDDSSMIEALMNHSQHRSSFHMEIQDESLLIKSQEIPRQESNLYRDLVEKYEALLEVQRNQSRNHKSLQQEMLLNNLTQPKDTDDESGHGDSLKTEKSAKTGRKAHTPTDFSEAETSSSGFSDEISNKATQTEERPGSFLCAIADGDDCKFSIYDDASPVASRFRNRPEYRELFGEIFTVLKKAADNKADGEELPLLDDCKKSIPKVPPVTPAAEDLPDISDTQSVMSSTMSELSTNPNEFVAFELQPDTRKDENILTPYVRQPLEYLSVGVNVRKRSTSRRKKGERSDSPATPILGSPKITYSNRSSSGRKRRESKLTSENQWNGTTMHFYSHNTALATTPQAYKPSTASQDLIKLKRLELSYADVLRNADKKKTDRSRPK